MVDAARRRRLFTWQELLGCVDGLREQRRHGLADVERVLADRVDPCDGPLAKQVLRAVLAAGIRRPELEHEVVVGGRVFHLDMAWVPEMVAVEVNGWDPHGVRTAFDHDAERSGLLASVGWLLVPVTSRTIARLPERLTAALALGAGRCRPEWVAS